MKAGDTVHDAITGEDWILAYYDPARDEAAWCGWPEGYVAEASKRLTVTKPCDEAEEIVMLRRWAAMRSDERGRTDWRTVIARRQLVERAIEAWVL